MGPSARIPYLRHDRRMQCITIAIIALGACSAQTYEPKLAHTIYWSDGDSGRIDGLEFRLADVDAPETGGVGAAIGGAECERERELGFEAKAFMVELTKDAELVITSREAPDRFGRVVLSLSADEEDVARSGLDAGYLAPWPHDGSQALLEKPSWCDH
ncbi:thermonuclease family protein [Henriciella algicola]|uniref:Thermonuclease family protein n=1 Tax=Henriciella algicola TaxID=1608422 RepID=A0A399RB97_9PROT|nr:thermonuclease family protein [Henriciella algicola]